MKKQIVRFSLVGGSAFAVHFSMVSIVVPLGIQPLAANVVGFLIAFGVSYIGHRYWTFPTANSARHAAVIRFFAVAVFGFAVNETLYWLLLAATPLGYKTALIVVLAVVAVMTFTVSRLWAFRDA